MHRILLPPVLMLVTALLLGTVLTTAIWAVPLAVPSTQNTPTTDESPTADDTGQEYIVQSGDSLYRISGRFYGDPDIYQRIVDATNAKAAVDSRFTRITNPRFIRIGQRLWIPDSTTTPIVQSPPAEEPATSTAPQTPVEPVVVRFVAPLDGAVVEPTFAVTMTATGLTVEPAGDINKNAGHFHILVDTDFVPAGDVIITDEQHIHYGQAQMTTTLQLEPGEHLLRLQFANGAHIALDGEQYRDTITVTVAADAMSEGPSVFFVAPTDGTTVSPEIDVVMGASDLTVEPAGDINENAGHFHILVDTDFVPAGDVIITDEQHIHYGQAQMTTTLQLEPGEHLLRLQFANGAHIALDGEQYRDTITVTVAADAMSEGPSVFFVAPTDSTTVSPEFDVVMGASDLTVEPAGDINENAGHFHILVDTDFVPAGDVIITDDQHIHYGQAQMTTTLQLEPGEHLLRLQFANGAHIALDGEQYRDTITVTVAADAMSEGPSVFFVEPTDGTTVSPEIDVVMGASDLTVEPAGDINENAGHFHILVNTDFVPAGDIIIADEQHIHYGQAQMTTTLQLEPGEHLLRLQFANGAHIALEGEQYRDTITVTVAEDVTSDGNVDGNAETGIRFLAPSDGATVSNPFNVIMIADGLIVEPAGEINQNAGHFHILVDTDFVLAGDLIINDDQHLHYGKGEAVTRLSLEPGEHVLRLQFANGAHIALDGEQYLDEITIVVEE